MKQFLTYVFSILLILSCSGGAKNESMISTGAAESEVVIFAEEDILKKVDLEKNTTHLNPLIKQKLQEYHDLLLLKKSNPEFSEEIKKQLKKLSEEKLVVDSIINEVTIENISFLSAPEYVSDSIQKIQFSYLVNSKTDSLTAIIKSTSIVIENQTVWSTNITFE